MIGQTLLHYRITDRLGAGGMGEVYLARDEKLNRDVALKILPEGSLSDDEARRRFRKEAEALSRLSHPHIATIHDFDSANGTDFLVMELVRGPSLRDEIEARGALPEKTVLRLGSQLARGLQAAHDQGIVHRDLKPSNLQLTEDGLLKILDFGLARLLPTETSGQERVETKTADGKVAGTLPYMSPEQLRGQEVDARTDLYAAGVVLYEMATGKRPLSKANAAELTSAILHEEPAPPRDVNDRISPGLEAVILKALDKDPELRCQTAKDLRVDLERLEQRSERGSGTAVNGARPGVAMDTGPRAARPSWPRERVAWAVLALVLGGLAAFLASRDANRAPEARPVARVSLEMPEDLPALRTDFQLSPDGRQVALTPWLPVVGSLWLRSLDTPGSRLVAGTHGASGSLWSPDGESLAFFVPGQNELALRRLDLVTNGIWTICTVPGGAWMGGDWNDEGRIIFSASDEQGRARLYTTSAGGGEPKILLELDAAGEERHHLWPALLPDGRRFLFTVDSPNDQVRGTWLSSLDRPRNRRLLLPGVRFARYAEPGYLLYVRGDALMAQPFDANRAELDGEPILVVPAIATAPAWEFGDLGLFATSSSGILAYAGRAGELLELAWFDREGTRLGTLGKPARYSQIQLSPDETRVAAEIREAESESPDVWTVDLGRGVTTRVTSDPAEDLDPVWSPEGRRLYFSSNRQGDGVFRLYRDRLDGGEPEALAPDTPMSGWSEGVSPDGTTLLYLTGGDGRNDTVWALPLTGQGRAERLMTVDHAVDEPRISPDGRWLAFGADDTGTWEVYVVPYGAPGERVLVSTGGGSQPRWRGDGRELFYVTPQGELMAVDLTWTAGRLAVGLPRLLFHAGVASAIRDEYAVTKDGQRFLVITPAEDARWSLDVVLNWPSLIER